MYSRKRYSDDADRLMDRTYSKEFEDEELCVYNLPPRYDGSRFRRPRRDEVCRRCEEGEQSVTPQYSPDIQKAETPCADTADAGSCKSENEGLLRFFEGMGGEELLIISLILTVAGGDDSGELLLFLILLLLHG